MWDVLKLNVSTDMEHLIMRFSIGTSIQRIYILFLLLVKQMDVHRMLLCYRRWNKSMPDLVDRS